MSSNAVNSAHELTLQRIDKRPSSRWMLFGVIFFSFFAGMKIDNGITRLLQGKAEHYQGIGDFALGFFFLVIAIRLAVRLLGRAKANQADSLVR
jgi:hypothetical protein